MRLASSFFCLLPSAFCLLLSGCGPATATVTGNVTVDGKPLAKGTISYVAADGASGENITVDVVDGKYTLTTTPGPKLVMITAPVVTGTRPEYNGPGAPLVEIREESLPPKFNSATELKYDVQPGENNKDWPTQTGPTGTAAPPPAAVVP